MSVTPMPRPPVDASPQTLYARMQAIEDELEQLKNEWAAAEDELVRTSARVERLSAVKRFELKKAPPAGVNKPTKEDLDALVLDWLWTEHEVLMTQHIDAEARTAGCKVIYKCAERALSGKQSRLSADVKLLPGGSRRPGKEG